MLTIRACANPTPNNTPRLPKRLARMRRAIESKRLDSFKKLHETLKQTADEEAKFLQELVKIPQYDDADEEQS